MEGRPFGDGPPLILEVMSMKKHINHPKFRSSLTRQQRRRKIHRLCTTAALALLLCATLAVPAFAAGEGNVAGVVEETWKAAAAQIKTVVNNVVFPALDMVLTVAFFGKVAMSYFDYKKHGQFEWTGPVILFACLVFCLIAPTYIWKIVGL